MNFRAWLEDFHRYWGISRFSTSPIVVIGAMDKLVCGFGHNEERVLALQLRVDNLSETIDAGLIVSANFLRNDCTKFCSHIFNYNVYPQCATNSRY